MGCHSHKQNAKGFEVCNTKNQYDKTSDCIGCHMTRTLGTVDKQNKDMRKDYASHNFLGVHSQEMVKKAVKLELSYKDEVLKLTINNRMGHSIITHPMRLKFVKTTITRDKLVIWSNFKGSPIEDAEASFIIVFKDAEGKTSMPNNAVEYKLNRKVLEKWSVPISYLKLLNSYLGFNFLGNLIIKDSNSFTMFINISVLSLKSTLYISLKLPVGLNAYLNITVINSFLNVNAIFGSINFMLVIRLGVCIISLNHLCKSINSIVNMHGSLFLNIKFSSIFSSRIATRSQLASQSSVASVYS